MPQGGNNRMSAEAIAKIEQWVKEGAKLDAGLDPKKPIESYAASPEQVRSEQIARLPAAESATRRSKPLACERWKQANPKLKPEIVPANISSCSATCPRDRATSTLKVMETQYGHLKRLLGSPATDWVEKVSLYVFSKSEGLHRVRPHGGEPTRSRSRRSRVARSSRSPNRTWRSSIRRGARRRAGGRQAAGTVETRRRRRTRKTAARIERLVGLLTEALGAASVVASAGNAPRWLALGLGSYMAAQVEPRSPYYHQLRQTAFANFDQGWKTRANEALGGGDQITADGVHAVGFALVEAMMSGDASGLPGLRQGHARRAGRSSMRCSKRSTAAPARSSSTGTGEWVAAHYGRLQ